MFVPGRNCLLIQNIPTQSFLKSRVLIAYIVLIKPLSFLLPIIITMPQVYEWWGSAARTKYPGSLYMTVSQLEAPATPLSPRPRSQSALQEERGSRVSNSAASTSATGSPVADGVHGMDEVGSTDC